MRNIIIQTTAKRPVGGVQSVLKNVERYFDHSDFMFQYLYSSDGLSDSFDSYLLARDSLVYLLPRISLRNSFLYFSSIWRFYKENSKDIAAVHVHAPNVALFHFLCDSLILFLVGLVT